MLIIGERINETRACCAFIASCFRQATSIAAKNDTAEAEAAGEIISRHTLRCVPIKSEEQQDVPHSVIAD